MSIKIKVGREDLIRYAIVLNLAYASYATFLYSFMGNTSILRNFLIVLVMSLNLYVIYMNISKIKILLTLAFVMGILLGATYIIYPANRWVIEDILIDVTKYVMLAFFIGIASEETLHRGLKSTSFVILFCGLFEPLTLYVTGLVDGYMVYGMRMLLAAVLFEYFYFKERNKLYLISTFITIILIFLYGNRSALLISFVCLVIYYLIFGEKKGRFKRYFSITVLVLLVVALISVDLLSMLAGMLEKMGVSSRTLTLLVAGMETVTDNNGRSIIWENCQKAIKQRPWTGYGIGGDRNLYLLGSNHVSKMGGGVYAHNFIYEIILDFGLLLGGFILAYVIYRCIDVVLNRYKWFGHKIFIGIFIATSIKLYFSSSIWSDMNTYVCVGLIMGYYRNKKNMKRMNMN